MIEIRKLHLARRMASSSAAIIAKTHVAHHQFSTSTWCTIRKSSSWATFLAKKQKSRMVHLQAGHDIMRSE